jgi:hypothetical protein
MYCPKTTNDISFLGISCEREAMKVFFSDFTAKARSSVIRLQWALADLTPSDLFPWGYIKAHVYVPPSSRDVQELKQRIQDAATMVTEDMLGRVL